MDPSLSPAPAELQQTGPVDVGVGKVALRGILLGDSGEKLGKERKLEGYVSSEMETWLQSAWDSFGENPEDPMSVVGKEYADDKHIVALKELHEELGTLGDPSEKLHDFIVTFGIANFGRYDPVRLAAQYTMWNSGNMNDFDTLHIVGRYGDENGAYNNVTGPFDNPDRVNGLVFETGVDDSEMTEVAKRVADKGAKIDVTVLSAHGHLERETPGKPVDIPDLGIYYDTDLSNLSQQLHRLSHRTPVVILDSCLASSETNVRPNFAKNMSENLPNTFVVAPDKTILETIRDDRGVIHFSNKAKDGNTILFNEVTGEELSTRLIGTAVRPKANAYMNGKVANVTSPVRGFNPVRLIGYSGS